MGGKSSHWLITCSCIFFPRTNLKTIAQCQSKRSSTSLTPINQVEGDEFAVPFYSYHADNNGSEKLGSVNM
ncbi:hypothetical protein GGR57DRAFT_476942 [Xylariaceae sp. FL1272]|nr:hypothetical protein GGR57DRAFT_476942 [Xylariaceae sp. FL1272]